MSLVTHVTVVTDVTVPQPRNLQSPSDKLPMIRGLSRRLGVLGRLLGGRWATGHRDDPGEAVLRDLCIESPRARSAFDFVDIHHGIESSRMRIHDMHGQGWSGS